MKNHNELYKLILIACQLRGEEVDKIWALAAHKRSKSEIAGFRSGVESSKFVPLYYSTLVEFLICMADYKRGKNEYSK